MWRAVWHRWPASAMRLVPLCIKRAGHDKRRHPSQPVDNLPASFDHQLQETEPSASDLAGTRTAAWGLVPTMFAMLAHLGSFLEVGVAAGTHGMEDAAVGLEDAHPQLVVVLVVAVILLLLLRYAELLGTLQHLHTQALSVPMLSWGLELLFVCCLGPCSRFKCHKAAKRLSDTALAVMPLG